MQNPCIGWVLYSTPFVSHDVGRDAANKVDAESADSALRSQNIPRVSFAASDMRSLVQGGSHTTSTFTSFSPGTSRTLRSTSSGICWADGQPGAVSVIRMYAFDALSTS